MNYPDPINDGRRLTKVMTSADGTNHIIMSYALDPAGNTIETGRWLHGVGPCPLGMGVPGAAMLSEIPSAADLARVHAEASAQ